MTLQEQRDKINSIVRWIGYTIYASQSKSFKFIKAYDRLVSKVLVDHGFSIGDSERELLKKGESMFDHLSSEQMTLVLASALELSAMYTEVLELKKV